MTDYGKVADEFIARVRATEITPTTEVNALLYCVDEHGRELPPIRMELATRTTVKAPGNIEWAKQFAAAAHLDTIIGNINSLIRPVTAERFYLPPEAPRIPMVLVRMELEITDV